MTTSPRKDRKPTTVNGVRYTASFGVVQCRFGSSDITHALNEADKALYHAKESGRNRVKSAGIVMSVTQRL